MMVSALDEYFFDLRGYLLLEGAITTEHVASLNACLDALPPMEPGEWYGYVHREKFEASRGIAYQQIYEAGEPFEALIDHPSWIEHVEHFVGGKDSFDWLNGSLFIDENFASIRGPGGAIGLHSGGHECVKRTQYLYRNGHFMCGQVNILLALTDIGPGDGGTMVIPGSHKANFEHPQFKTQRVSDGASVDGVAGAIEVHMKAGDAILFVDALSHGSAKRVNEGERRFVVYRYGPSWGNFRFGYRPSPELLARLTERRRKIVQPLPVMERVPNVG
ncbi:MAG: phytanoyl-CoA dioxygenase family protein [Anaerolineales bacterium]|nr:phytanoyl-CoA dioxygenase family protein [Anaerolineales bacterium]MCB0018587.1 phytanoyl-CoA dioxygenase family protein [Anaerolineales bacterium]MCB0031246.1 phytanoyl-CoA dioxygenase family protein [Anaerolineales bacterium]